MYASVVLCSSLPSEIGDTFPSNFGSFPETEKDRREDETERNKVNPTELILDGVFVDAGRETSISF